MDQKSFRVSDEHADLRLDVYVTTMCLPNESRTKIKKFIKSGVITVNKQIVLPSYSVKANDTIDCVPSLYVQTDDIIPENIPLDVLYDDEDLLIINKQPGLVVHPAAGNKTHTLVNALKHYFGQNLSKYGGEDRSGIVHRLDKETSGLMIVAKNDAAHKDLAKQFKQRIVKKSYIVLVKGVVQHDQGKCDQPIGKAKVFRKKMIVEHGAGKNAFSEYSVVRRFRNATLLQVKIHTGRTHQIRVHMAYLGHPVIGDLVYGVSSPLISRQFLHASKLEFRHPRTQKSMVFEAPLPDDIESALAALSIEDL